jgi:N6-adenosine-specific RNA methylase IME4
MGSLFDTSVPAPPRAGEYRVLYPDAPWPEHGGGKIQRGADRHYGLMKVSDIVDLFRTFGEWAAPDAHLYAWATNNYLPAAFECIKAAGFRYVTTVTWVKDRAGLGQYYRGRTEHCLFAVRGRLPYLVAPNGKRAQGHTVIYCPELEVEDLPPPVVLPDAFEAPRGQHSKKPEQMRHAIELVSGGHGPMLELFARRGAPNWDVWGNQAPSEATHA